MSQSAGACPLCKAPRFGPTSVAGTLTPVPGADEATRYIPATPASPSFDPDATYFAALLGLVVEDVRVDYCRMRLPWRPEISQPFGVAHGGALSTLLDSSVVPAIGSGYETAVSFATVDMTVQFMGALRDEDAVAEGWITQRGKSMIFCESEAIGARSGRRVARAVLTYKVSG